jgi:hypothetical protein
MADRPLPSKLDPQTVSDPKGTRAAQFAGPSGFVPGKQGATKETTTYSDSSTQNLTQVSEDQKNTATRTQPVHEISLKVANSSSTQLDIHVVERGGNVRVAVRTQDQELTQSLQTNLGELVGRLEQKGYKTETWVPVAQLSPSAAPAQASHGSGYSQDQPQHSGSWTGSQQHSPEQQDSQRRQQARWMIQLKESLGIDQSSIEIAKMEAH